MLVAQPWPKGALQLASTSRTPLIETGNIGVSPVSCRENTGDHSSEAKFKDNRPDFYLIGSW
jgi:hypothetical protein